ncbi:hypothetical protein OAT67_05045 [Bacteriovoracaceae bacterium]|nr:hypothetical protein [Bacteriovoracaceae bacterium]
MKEKVENIIFYWDGTGHVSPQFTSLSHKIKRWGITLIPVSSAELPELVDGRPRVLIVNTSTILQNEKYQKFKKNYLNFAVLNRKIKMIHISSFGMEDDFRSVLRSLGYSFHPLPLTATYVAGKAASVFYSEEMEEKQWPGGKRARLPDVPSGSQ